MNKNILERLSYHAVYDESILDAIEFANDSGFSGIQVAVESPHLSFENLTNEDRAEIRRRKTEMGIRITLHGPDDVTSLLQTNSHIRSGILAYYSDLFKFAADIGAAITTIHIGQPVTFRTDTVPETQLPDVDVSHYRHALEENLSRVISLAENRTLICVENYSLQEPIMQVFADYLSAGKVGLCWDIAKTFNRDGSINGLLLDYIMTNLAAIRQVHLHDINDKGLSHRVIGTGNIDFKYYLGLLEGADVRDYCIEVRPREKAVESMLNLKKMLQ